MLQQKLIRRIQIYISQRFGEDKVPNQDQIKQVLAALWSIIKLDLLQHQIFEIRSLLTLKLQISDRKIRHYNFLSQTQQESKIKPRITTNTHPSFQKFIEDNMPKED